MLAGPYLAAAALLVLAGAAKVLDPLPLVRALRSAGLRLRPTTVRAAAVAETGLGLWAGFTSDQVAAALLALTYAGFTGFVLLARTRGGVLASCGCFGRPDTPPTMTHAVVTGLFAAVAAGAGRSPAGSLPKLLARTPTGGMALVAVTAALAAVAYLLLALLPLLGAASRPRTDTGGLA